MKKQLATKIQNLLVEEFPDPKPALVHHNAFELLISVILSAQTTDVRVNIVTPELFRLFPTPEKLSKADPEVVRKILKTIGFYNVKTKNIIACAQMLVKDFGGEVPNSIAELIKLPGAARKTASVVLSQWFGIEEGFTVDTHVIRLSQRFGLTKFDDPINIEKDMMKLFPQPTWGKTSLRIILHGRQVCFARGPMCSTCILNQVCESAFKVKGWK